MSATRTKRPAATATAATKKAVNSTKNPAPASKKAVPSKTAKAPPKAEPKAATNHQPSSKRKAEDEVEEEPKVNGIKRVKPSATITDVEDKAVKSIKAVKASPPKKTAVSKAPAAVKAKAKKGPVNEAPTEKLNVYVFGEGSSGELGLGSAKGQSEVKRPRLNPNLSADTVGVVSLSVGGMHTAALTHDNKILTWGVNDQGALGRDTTWDGGLRDIAADASDSDDDSDSGSDTAINPKESTPGEVDCSELPEGLLFTQVVATDSATFVLTSQGDVYGWGTFRSNEGIFGFDNTTLIQLRPKLIKGLKQIASLAAGANHVLALQHNGIVYGWGSGQQNQLGRRILERRATNSLIPMPIGLPKKIVHLGAGSYNSFAVRENGDVYSWGLNNFGQTGIPKEFDETGASVGSDVHAPEVIKSLKGKGKVICIGGGAHHTVAVTDKGELLVWGRLDGNQLGLKVSDLAQDQVVRDTAGNPRILTTPTQIPSIDAVQAAAGSDHCVAIDRKGRAYAWGFSTTFQTGLGTDDDVELATQIDNTAVRDKKLVWAGAGGQFSIIAGLAQAPLTNGVNGHA